MSRINPTVIKTTNKQRISLMAIAVIAIAGTVIASTAGVFTTDPPTTVYNPKMTDWWDDLIESLGDESSAVWT